MSSSELLLSEAVIKKATKNSNSDGVTGTQVQTQTVYVVTRTSLPDQRINHVVQTHNGMLSSLQKG